RSPEELRVFVSSTSKDLEDYRAVARNIILELHWFPEMMEFWDAQPSLTVQTCRESLDACDLVLLIVAFQQGWVPATEQGGNGRDSITALELEHARARNIPVLILLAKRWDGGLWEDDQNKRAWVKQFREGLNQNARFFDEEPSSTNENQRFPAFRSL